jgi:ubiquinone/menaquinone biosynthesis C-methylase UbiE
MEMLAYTILAVICIIGCVFVVWHFGSRRFELPCPVWLRWMVEMDNPFTKTCRAQTIIEHLGIELGMTVLDAGCGPGRLTIPLAKGVGEHGRVVAMDIQEGMLVRTKQKVLAEALSNIEFLQAGLGQGALGTSRFDRALLVTVLGEIPDRAMALKEISGALKPGGILSITETIFDPHFQHRGATSVRLNRIEMLIT